MSETRPLEDGTQAPQKRNWLQVVLDLPFIGVQAVLFVWVVVLERWLDVRLSLPIPFVSISYKWLFLALLILVVYKM